MAQQSKQQRTKERPPLIWAYQPTSFEVVTPERLKLWEQAMVKYVGLGHVIGDKINIKGATIGGTCSFSYSGPTDQAPDDCDQD